jgi:hypothetical protein
VHGFCIFYRVFHASYFDNYALNSLILLGLCFVQQVLSTIISRQYGQLTAPDGKVQRFTPDIAPGMLGFVIPEGYKGEALPLWRFLIKPNYD